MRLLSGAARMAGTPGVQREAGSQKTLGPIDIQILPRQGEVAPKASEGEVGSALSIERRDSAPSVTLCVPPPPGGGGLKDLGRLNGDTT